MQSRFWSFFAGITLGNRHADQDLNFRSAEWGLIKCDISVDLSTSAGALCVVLCETYTCSILLRHRVSSIKGRLNRFIPRRRREMSFYRRVFTRRLKRICCSVTKGAPSGVRRTKEWISGMNVGLGGGFCLESVLITPTELTFLRTTITPRKHLIKLRWHMLPGLQRGSHTEHLLFDNEYDSSQKIITFKRYRRREFGTAPNLQRLNVLCITSLTGRRYICKFYRELVQDGKWTGVC